MARARQLAGQQVVFASDALPAHLDDKARRERFRETFERLICGADISFPEERPFFMRHQFAQANEVRVGRTGGTISRIVRDAGMIARNPDDDLFVIVNYGPARICVSQMGREATLDKEEAIVLTHGETVDFRVEGPGDWIGVMAPHEPICTAVTGVEDMIARPLAGQRSLPRLLASYAEGLLALDPASYDVMLAQHARTTIVDLVTLILGGERDAVEIAGMRGLRAARLGEILTRIKIDFADPGFSSDVVARHLGLSRRYVNDLLAESGSSFVERVLELRLQKAKAILSSARHDRMRVGDVAYACGFNEVSYFNRRFRARFGCSPTQARPGRAVP